MNCLYVLIKILVDINVNLSQNCIRRVNPVTCLGCFLPSVGYEPWDIRRIRGRLFYSL